MLPPQTQIQPDRLSTYDVFAESQRRLSVATHALVQSAQRLAAARALRRPLDKLFDEVEVLIAVNAREHMALAEAATAVQIIERELDRG